MAGDKKYSIEESIKDLGPKIMGNSGPRVFVIHLDSAIATAKRYGLSHKEMANAVRFMGGKITMDGRDVTPSFRAGRYES